MRILPESQELFVRGSGWQKSAAGFSFPDLLVGLGVLSLLLLLQISARHAHAQGLVLDREFTQSDLAGMIGASRPAVNRALQSLAARGLIAVRGRVVEIRDLDGLKRRAEL